LGHVSGSDTSTDTSPSTPSRPRDNTSPPPPRPPQPAGRAKAGFGARLAPPSGHPRARGRNRGILQLVRKPGRPPPGPSDPWTRRNQRPPISVATFPAPVAGGRPRPGREGPLRKGVFGARLAPPSGPGAGAGGGHSPTHEEAGAPGPIRARGAAHGVPQKTRKFRPGRFWPRKLAAPRRN